MGDKPQCSSCGADLAPDTVAQGLCAPCLLKLGLTSTNIPPAEYSGQSVVAPASQPAPRLSAKFPLITGAAVIAAFALAVGIFLLLRSRPPDMSVLRFTI